MESLTDDMATAAENIARVLQYYGLTASVWITKVDPDRCWGWPNGDGLLVHMVLNGWLRDAGMIANANHGTPISFREPGGVHPAMQVCVHPVQGHPYPYFLEMDLDFAAGTDFAHPDSVLIHAGEVIQNKVTGQKTDQDRIAEMLNKRFSNG